MDKYAVSSIINVYDKDILSIIIKGESYIEDGNRYVDMSLRYIHRDGNDIIIKKETFNIKDDILKMLISRPLKTFFPTNLDDMPVLWDVNGFDEDEDIKLNSIENILSVKFRYVLYETAFHVRQIKLSRKKME